MTYRVSYRHSYGGMLSHLDPRAIAPKFASAIAFHDSCTNCVLYPLIATYRGLLAIRTTRVIHPVIFQRELSPRIETIRSMVVHQIGHRVASSILRVAIAIPPVMFKLLLDFFDLLLDFFDCGHKHHAIRIIALLYLVQVTHAVEPGDKDSMKCAIFDGTSTTFVAWLISFTAWVSWKKPELVGLIDNTDKKPGSGADPDVKRAWDLLNVQLYGAIVSHTSASIQASLHINARRNGRSALKYLKDTYGSKNVGDRAEAMSRLQKSYIDPRAKLNEADVIKQYNHMSLAAADIATSGGTAIDDALLISLFENSLPSSYAQIRQMVRYRAHQSFVTYYDDFLSQVRAEVRSTQRDAVGAFYVNPNDLYPHKGKGKGKGGKFKGGKGVKGGRGRGRNTHPCFNCLSPEHGVSECPEPRVTCEYCEGWHHPKLCPLGPPNPIKDSLATNALRILESHAFSNKRSRGGRGKGAAFLTQNDDDDEGESQGNKHPRITLDHLARAYDFGQTTARGSGASVNSSVPPSKAMSVKRSAAGASSSQSTTTGDRPQTISEIDEFIQSLSTRGGVFCVSNIDSYPMSSIDGSHVAFIDSQASNFVVPSSDFLSEITNSDPSQSIDTAGGAIQPSAVGDLRFVIYDDHEFPHSFHVRDAWVIPSCHRVLYSQPSMHELGVIHRLDEGYIMFPDGNRLTVTKPTYAIQIYFESSSRNTAHSTTLASQSNLLVPVDDNFDQALSHTIDPAKLRSKTAPPQQLLWQRLGFPSKATWSHSGELLTGHGLPPNTHLQHDFPVIEAVANARAKMQPFNSTREPDSLPAPGAKFFMDFAGPTIPSYPHKFNNYCGVIDAGSGYARVVSCHSPTSQVARDTLQLLQTDMRSLMNLTHKLSPQIVVSDQGTQFMAHSFQDFLHEGQSRHWPSTVYTPQQNSVAERLWGTRFGTARVLLTFARLSPAFHPFAMQMANWLWNRLPTASRGNLSPFFILSRKVASVAHIKTFGCLVRLTLPTQHRTGDKHFSDRGTLGLYLGPSEKSPGSIIYVPKSKRFYVSRHFICYEDVFPGVGHPNTKWNEINTIDELSKSVSSGRIGMDFNDHSDQSIPNSVDISTEAPVTASVDFDHSTSLETDENSITEVHDDRVEEDHMERLEGVATSDSPLLLTHNALPAGDTGDPNDPSSRRFSRTLPNRSSRYQGAYFVHPDALHYNPFVYLTCVSTFSHPYVVDPLDKSGIFSVTSTTDHGDITIPRSYDEALGTREASYWKEAICKELNGLLSLNAFETVKRSRIPTGANIIRCHMVFTVKRNKDGTVEKFKCRLVANGRTQRYGVDYEQIFSTVAKLSTLRITFTLAAARGYNLTSIDIRMAYLQALLHEEIYMECPPGLPNVDADGDDVVVRLKRSLYGLKQAGRRWSETFRTCLINFGFSQSQIDTCLFVYQREQSLIWVVVWVDDCVIVDNDRRLRQEFVTHVSNTFPTEDKGELEWILQVAVTHNRDNGTITLSQQLYVRDMVQKFGSLLDGMTRRFDSPFDPSQYLSHDDCPIPGSHEDNAMQPYREAYASLVGGFLWLSNMTRPELGYISGQLARFLSNPGKVHYRAALRVLVYLRDTQDVSLTIHPSSINPTLRAFVDSDWGTRYSISGGIIDLMGVPVHWFSRVQRSVSMSSTEAEYFATCVMVRELLFIKELLTDFGVNFTEAIVIRTDNKGVVDLSWDPVAFKKTKHILRAAEYVRDMVIRRFVVMQWIESGRNPADLFTKPVKLAVYRVMLKLLRSLNTIA